MDMNNKGFTLLFASLIVSLVLSVGIAIANITLAQLTLSTAGRESQIALYNADTALECALYYQYKKFSQEDGSPFFPEPDEVEEDALPMKCATLDNEKISSDNARVSTVGTTTTTVYTFNLSPVACEPKDPAFQIEVNKTSILKDGIPVGNIVNIRTRGYNTCNPNNPRRVERGLYVRNIIE